ncbi:hypothetical protein DLM_3909 [Aquitalea magnusonii]|uniref:Uncharacterized protein n=1 Tax=Aquitalea magnusonii TaxID=332411 RepID=A0A3G9GHZ0_9NEIS|nr:hypothetical protein DLM_3909 [Aquitalea magnusonii]
MRCLLGNPKAVAGRAFLLTGFDGIATPLQCCRGRLAIFVMLFFVLIVFVLFSANSS